MELDDAACGPLVLELQQATTKAVAASDLVARTTRILDAAIANADKRHSAAIAESRWLRTHDVVVASAEGHGVRLARKYFS